MNFLKVTASNCLASIMINCPLSAPIAPKKLAFSLTGGDFISIVSPFNPHDRIIDVFR